MPPLRGLGWLRSVAVSPRPRNLFRFLRVALSEVQPEVQHYHRQIVDALNRNRASHWPNPSVQARRQLPQCSPASRRSSPDGVVPIRTRQEQELRLILEYHLDLDRHGPGQRVKHRRRTVQFPHLRTVTTGLDAEPGPNLLIAPAPGPEKRASRSHPQCPRPAPAAAHLHSPK